MANGFFTRAMREWARGNIAWLASGGVDARCALIDQGAYVVDLTDTLLSDITGGGATVVGGWQVMTLIDADEDGVIDAADQIITGLSSPPTLESVLIVEYNSGTPGNSLPLIWIDQGTGLVIAANATGVEIQWPNGATKLGRI